MNQRALSYSQVNLVPRYSELRTRADADVSVEFLGRKLALPIAPSNMQAVINEDIARYLSENNYAYFFHRFGNTRAFIERANRENWKLISISVGVKEVDKDLLKWVVKEDLRVDWICIDIAHGHHVLVKEMIEFIKSRVFTSYMSDYIYDSFAIREGKAAPGRGFTSVPLAYIPKIIAGNVATSEAVRGLAEWGADAVKVGVGPSKVCTTRHKTGFHVPMWTCVKECVEMGGVGSSADIPYGRRINCSAKIPIIADGGCREPGDIAKVLTAGATLAMVGGMVAACTDAPGENIYANRAFTIYETGAHESEGPITHKRFHGSASSRQKGEKKHVEGIEIDLPCNGMTIQELYRDVKESLSSAVSYSGGKDLSALKNVEWVEVTG